MPTPRMDHTAAEERERNRRHVRAFHDAKVIDSFRFHGLSIAEMDRAELLGVISFLASSTHLHTVKITDN